MVHQIDTSIGLSCPAQGYPLPAFRCVTNCWFLKLYFLEPIGGAKPKFSQILNGVQILHDSNSAISLSCPAQGFPLPAFRLDQPPFLCYWNIISEPIGGQKPKFSENVHSKSIIREVKYPVTLECPAQGFPLPAFRLDKFPFY